MQRVRSAHVEVDDTVVGSITHGLLVLLAAREGDDESDLEYVCRKIAGLRIFEDEEGRMNRAVGDVEGSVLLVSQFTLYGDVRKGRRPSFVQAMHPDQAAPMIDRAAERLRSDGIPVETGVFGADMQVHLVNDGPVTLLIESDKSF